TLETIATTSLQWQVYVPHSILHQAVHVGTFTVPNLKNFLARILQSPLIQEKIKGFMDTQSQQNGSVNDILFSPYIQGLQDINGGQFVRFDDHHLHICLGLYLDWFAPRGNRLGAAHYSTGVMYLIILNLPPDIRHHSDYLCPIFIPGPQEPTTDGLNHLLGPIVSQLDRLFHEGFTLRGNCTPAIASRKVRAMLAIIIADVLAECKCGGFASHAHQQFCHHCRIQRSQMTENFDAGSWKRINREKHLNAIKLWRDARSVEHRKRIFDKWGFRWTELARLKYLDLTKCFVIDPMHAVLLGVIRTHIRQIFGLTDRVESSQTKVSTTKVFPQEELRGEEILSRRYLNSKLLDILAGFHSPTLEFLCRQRNIDFLDVPLRSGKPRKVDMVASLGRWIDCSEIDGILEVESLSRNEKSLRLNLQPVQELYRACEDRDINMSYLTYRKDFPPKGNMIELLLSGRPKQSQVSSSTLWRQAHQRRSTESLVDSQNGMELEENELDPSSEIVINNKFLKIIWDDISMMKFPPDCTDLPPHKIGLPSTGKLKAAQWPNVCIGLIPSLTKEWTRYPEGSDQQKWLQNFYHLIGLTRLLYLHSVTEDDIRNFKRHSVEYVKGYHELFPSHRMKPNHHYLLHLGDMMHSFGPMRSWWSFPYERMNGDIQKISTNSKAGQIEKSFLQSFLYRQQLGELLNREPLSQFARLAKQRLQANLDLHSFHSLDWDPQDLISPSSFELLKQIGVNRVGIRALDALRPYVVALQSVIVQGKDYRPFSISESHGFAGYMENGYDFGAGYIQEIFQYHWEPEGPLETFVVLEALQPSPVQPFSAAPEVGARLFERVEGTRTIFLAENLCSVIWAPWSDEKIVVFLPKEIYVRRRI
ncbi:10619_t:CDS:2, partial [Acaulospora colombiana]